MQYSEGEKLGELSNTRQLATQASPETHKIHTATQ